MEQIKRKMLHRVAGYSEQQGCRLQEAVAYLHCYT